MEHPDEPWFLEADVEADIDTSQKGKGKGKGKGGKRPLSGVCFPKMYFGRCNRG